MSDPDEVPAWLETWQGMGGLPSELEAAAGAAHRQVRALDRAAARLRVDDEPWRIRRVLAQRARR